MWLLPLFWFSAAAPASPALRRPPQRTPLVVVVRRPGLRPYQLLAEEFGDHVRALVRVVAARKAGGPSLRRWLLRSKPDLVLAVGQLAYDLIRHPTSRGPAAPADWRPPLLYAFVYHRQAAADRGIPARIAPSHVLQALRAARPRLRRVAALCSPDTKWLVDAAASHGSALSLVVEPLVARSPAGAIAQLRRLHRGVEALWLLTDLKLLSPQVLQYAIALQFRRRIPLLTASRHHVARGALLALDYDPALLGREAAVLANRLLGHSARHKPPRKAPASPRRAINARLRVLAGPYGSATPRLTVNAATAKRIGVGLSELRHAGAEMLH